jgi:hypothetical protein
VHERARRDQRAGPARKRARVAHGARPVGDGVRRLLHGAAREPARARDRALELCNCSLQAASLKTLAPVLETLTGLRKLDLGQNELPGAAVAPLAPALQSLSLFVCRVGVAGVGALRGALGSLAALTHLRMDGNALGLEGVRELAKATEKLPALREVILYDNKLPESTQQVMRDVLPEGCRLAIENITLDDEDEDLSEEDSWEEDEDVLQALTCMELDMIRYR